jgi:hypothetical protein
MPMVGPYPGNYRNHAAGEQPESVIRISLWPFWSGFISSIHRVSKENVMTAAMQSAPRNDRIYFCAPVNALVEALMTKVVNN